VAVRSAGFARILMENNLDFFRPFLRDRFARRLPCHTRGIRDGLDTREGDEHH